jgi:hypothetical protein
VTRSRGRPSGTEEASTPRFCTGSNEASSLRLRSDFSSVLAAGSSD